MSSLSSLGSLLGSEGGAAAAAAAAPAVSPSSQGERVDAETVRITEEAIRALGQDASDSGRGGSFVSKFMRRGSQSSSDDDDSQAVSEGISEGDWSSDDEGVEGVSGAVPKAGFSSGRSILGGVQVLGLGDPFGSHRAPVAAKAAAAPLPPRAYKPGELSANAALVPLPAGVPPAVAVPGRLSKPEPKGPLLANSTWYFDGNWDGSSLLAGGATAAQNHILLDPATSRGDKQDIKVLMNLAFDYFSRASGDQLEKTEKAIVRQIERSKSANSEKVFVIVVKGLHQYEVDPRPDKHGHIAHITVKFKFDATDVSYRACHVYFEYDGFDWVYAYSD